MESNTFKIGHYTFPVTKATFRYIIDRGWAFEIRTKPSKDLSRRSVLYGKAPRFYSEGDPIPLDNLSDLTGSEIRLKEAFSKKSGEPYFTLYVFEHGDLTNLRLKFVKRNGPMYRIRITATVPAGSVFSTDKRLRIETWIKRLSAKRYN